MPTYATRQLAPNEHDYSDDYDSMILQTTTYKKVLSWRMLRHRDYSVLSSP